MYAAYFPDPAAKNLILNLIEFFMFFMVLSVSIMISYMRDGKFSKAILFFPILLLISFVVYYIVSFVSYILIVSF